MTNRRYWIFQCNPQKYDLLARLEEPDAWITWTIRQHQDEVSRGDVAFLWVSGADAGIAAVMEIDTDPIVMHELPAEQRHWKGETGEDPALRVIGRLVRRGVGLSRDVIRQTPGLEELSTLRMPRATNFAVSADEAAALLRLIES